MILAVLFDGDVQRNIREVKRLKEPISEEEL